jgi:hypothetical protein
VRSYLVLPKRPRDDRPPAFRDDYRYPQELVETFLREFTREGDRVLDPFAGFGTTLAAAERLGRVPLGVECLPERVAFVRGRLRTPDAIIAGDARRLTDLGLPPVDFSMASPPFVHAGDLENPLDPVPAARRPDAPGGAPYRAYLEDLRAVYAQLAALLRPGGRVVIHSTNLRRGDALTPLAWDVARTVGGPAGPLRFAGEVVICWQGAADDEPGSSVYEHEYCLLFGRP